MSIRVRQLSRLATSSNGAADWLVKAMSVIDRSALPLLLMVTVLSDDVPTVTSPKTIDVVDTAIFGVGAGVPVPLTLIVVIAVSGSSDGMSKLSLKSPDKVGVNRTVTVQLAAGSSDWFEQLSWAETISKGAARVSIPAMPPISRSALPEFETVR